MVNDFLFYVINELQNTKKSFNSIHSNNVVLCYDFKFVSATEDTLRINT